MQRQPTKTSRLALSFYIPSPTKTPLSPNYFSSFPAQILRPALVGRTTHQGGLYNSPGRVV